MNDFFLIISGIIYAMALVVLFGFGFCLFNITIDSRKDYKKYKEKLTGFKRYEKLKEEQEDAKDILKLAILFFSIIFISGIVLNLINNHLFLNMLLTVASATILSTLVNISLFLNKISKDLKEDSDIVKDSKKDKLNQKYVSYREKTDTISDKELKKEIKECFGILDKINHSLNYDENCKDIKISYNYIMDEKIKEDIMLIIDSYDLKISSEELIETVKVIKDSLLTVKKEIKDYVKTKTEYKEKLDQELNELEKEKMSYNLQAIKEFYK